MRRRRADARTVKLEAAVERPPPREGARVGAPPPNRTARLRAVELATPFKPPPLPQLHTICAEQSLTATGAAKDLGEDLLGEGAYWMGVQQLGDLYFNMSGVLDRARLASCAGQGRHGSPLHITPARLTADGVDVNTELFVGSVRRWLGIPPPGIMELQVCGACTQALGVEGRDDGPGERAAHLATCNSANKDETAQRGAHTTYHTGHTALREAVRQCGEEALGKDCVEMELSGMIEGSQQRPGDVVLHLNGNKVAVGVTIPRIQTQSNWST